MQILQIIMWKNVQIKQIMPMPDQSASHPGTRMVMTTPCRQLPTTTAVVLNTHSWRIFFNFMKTHSLWVRKHVQIIQIMYDTYVDQPRGKWTRRCRSVKCFVSCVTVSCIGCDCCCVACTCTSAINTAAVVEQSTTTTYYSTAVYCTLVWSVWSAQD